MLCAGAVTAQFVGGKATRDALFLASLDLTALPAMLVATSVCSILLVALNSKAALRFRPAALVPAAFVASGVLFLFEWLLAAHTRPIASVVVYLHISGAGPLLASGFWLIVSERFDPRTAKKRFGQIAGAGTIGGLLSALLAERIAAHLGVAAMLPCLAAIQFVSAWLVRRVALEAEATVRPLAPRSLAGKPDTTFGLLHAASADARLEPASRSGLRAVAETPYLRNLAALVLLGTTSAALVDYLFKATALQTFGRGDGLLRFFALYYAATSVVTFVIQTSSSRFMLERFGLALTTSTPSFALLAGSISGLVAPGFGSLIAARGGESVFRSSLFRSGYELFYTPMPAAEKRAAKSIIDVAFDRLGDAVGGALVRAVTLLAPAAQSSVILSLGIAASAGAILAASRLNRGYIRTLENSLLNHAAGVDLSDAAEESITSTKAFGALRRARTATLLQTAVESARRPGDAPASTTLPGAARSVSLDPDVQDILRLRSRDRDQIIDVLLREDGLSAALVPHAIPLLAWNAMSDAAIFALRKVAEERVGQLVDAMIDPNQDFAVRRRLARVFSVCVSQRAVDGLLLGLDDGRFDVRYQCGRSLSAIVEKNPRVQIDRERIFAVVMQEAAVGRPVWESRRLLDDFRAKEPESALDDFVRGRAGESLAHVFTLLSLVLPREPLQMAFRGLHSDDEQLQGTALEYLEGVLPAPIRERLWPFLERRPLKRSSRSRHELISELLRSHHSIRLNLQELRRDADGYATHV
jgi:AAA family ATP:ADP antiporter